MTTHIPTPAKYAARRCSPGGTPCQTTAPAEGSAPTGLQR